MNPLAKQLNEIIISENPALMDMLSAVGKNIFFPKGILSQGAEAKEKAYKVNATVGIAMEEGHTMYFDSVMQSINNIKPRESLTYAPSYGIPRLRKFWKETMVKKNPSLSNKTISLPIVTSGITHAVSIFADIWLDPGNVVVVPNMMWGNYNMIFHVRKGAEIFQYPMFSQNNAFNLSGFEKALEKIAETHNKIIVMLNFPHNPTGYTLTGKEGVQVAELLTRMATAGTNIIAVCDDSYFGLFYEEETLKESMFALLSNRHPRLLTVKLDGATKENYVWGLRVGFITYGSQVPGGSNAVYEALEKKTAGCVRGTISNASHLSQSILLKSFQNDRYPMEHTAKYTILKNRAMRVKAILSDPKFKDAWDVYPFNSGYFMCLRLKTVESERLRSHLLEKYGVGLIALGKTDIRVAFSCIDEDQIPGLFDIILQGIKDIEETKDK